MELEFCFVEALKLFKKVISSLNAKFDNEGVLSLENQLGFITNLINKEEHFEHIHNYLPQKTTSDLYQIIFKYCENALRNHYGFSGKLNTDISFLKENVKKEFDSKIAFNVSALLPILIKDVTSPNEATERILNYRNKNRWKIKLNELKYNYKKGSKEFVDSVILLANLNKLNPTKKYIYFDASVFIADLYKEDALTLYFYYLNIDLNSPISENKEFPISVQKSLFSNNEQLRNFEIIVHKFIKDKNFEKALNSISNIYVSSRKKIDLDINKIQEVKVQHSETVGLLNEYLNDKIIEENDLKKQVQYYDSLLTKQKISKFKKEITDIHFDKEKRKKIKLDGKIIEELKLQQSETIVLLNEYLKDDNDEIIPIKIFKTEAEIVNSLQRTNNNDIHSNYLVEFIFSKNQIFALEMFKENNFSVSQSKLVAFAKSNGVFSHQLIESINEVCYDYLDDILIEEESENYIINPNYYQNILVK